MFEIEAHNMVICTCTISDEDEERIRQYILNNPEKFQYKSDEEAIIEAIGDLEINKVVTHEMLLALKEFKRIFK